MEFIVYTLYWVVAVVALVFSLARFRNPFHPQTLITIITIILFMSDFLVSGYKERIVGLFNIADIIWHQITILYVCLAIFFITYIISRFGKTKRNLNMSLSNISWSRSGIIPLVAYLIVIIDIVKRLYSTGWSPTKAFLYSIAARGSAPWNIKGGIGNLGDINFIYGLSLILIPFCSLVMFCKILDAKGFRKIFPSVFLIIAIFILFADGTRAPLVFVISLMCIIYYFNCNSFKKRFFAIIISLIMLAAVTSTMYLYRARGYIDFDDKQINIEFVYHQDDNYFQAIKSLVIANESSERWDSLKFLTVIIVNPIPRYFWQNKPALLSDYWGNYKNEWTTITALGELTAMFGPLVGPPATALIAVLLYFLLGYIYKMNHSSFGFIVYMTFAFYAYSVMRSLLNISQFIYLPIFLLFLSKFALPQIYRSSFILYFKTDINNEKDPTQVVLPSRRHFLNT